MAGISTTEEQALETGLVKANAQEKPETLTLPRGAHLSLVTTQQSLDSLEEPWLALEQAASNTPSVFQSYSWISSWAKTYITDQSATELCIVTGFDEGKLVFVLPLMKEKSAAGW